MSYVRADGYRLKDPEDDAAFQVVVGDLQRLALNLARGSATSAYDVNNINNQAANAFGIPLLATVLTSGTSHVLLSNTTFFYALMSGGGAAGGGGPAGGSYAWLAQGGGAGACIGALFKVTSTFVTYAIGALGTGVSGATGNSGTATTISYNGTTLTAGGGYGGRTNINGSGNNNGGRPDLGTIGTGCTIFHAVSGQAGDLPAIMSWYMPTSAIQSTLSGGGGNSLIINGTYYSRGGGGENSFGTAVTGQNGSDGVMIITEFA